MRSESDTKWSRTLPTLQLEWSAHSLRSFATCPRRYYYEIVRGLRLAAKDTSDTAFGSLYHGALEEFDRAILAGKDVTTARQDVLLWVLDHSGERIPHDQMVWVPLPMSEGAKSRWSLIRAVLWYIDDFERQGENGVMPYAFPDGTPGLELEFAIPLPMRFFHPEGETKDGQTVFGEGEQYFLRGYLDSLCTAQGQTFVRERKTTKNAIGPYYFDGYTPDPQIDTYDLVASVLFPELKIAGVMVEAMQTGVNFARFQRQPIHRTPAQRDEWYEEIIALLGEAETCARNDAWPRRTAVCGLYGGCPFRKVCGKSPSVRELFLKGGDYRKENR